MRGATARRAPLGIYGLRGLATVNVTADRSALPDPGHYADCMQSAFQEMLSAAG
jgi:hypothetical protein